MMRNGETERITPGNQRGREVQEESETTADILCVCVCTSVCLHRESVLIQLQMTHRDEEGGCEQLPAHCL
jgi:hypothetical protein